MKFEGILIKPLGAILLVAACSSSTPQVAVDGGLDAGPEVTCAQWAAADCTYLNQCTPGTLQTTYGTVANCNSIRYSDCAENLAAPNTGFTHGFLNACTPSLVSLGGACDAGPVPGAVPSSTDPCAIIGALDAGSPCGIAAQCATDNCQRVGTLCGTCTAPGQTGEGCDLATGVTCPRGMTCSGNDSTCVTTVGLNGTCDLGVTTACVAGTSCVIAAAGATGGTCQASGASAGVSCSAKGIGAPDCYAAAGFFCDDTGHCSAISYAANSAACGTPDSGVSETACAFGECVSSSCDGRVDAGEPCTLNQDPTCEEGLTCVASGGAAMGACTATSPSCATATFNANFVFQPSNVSLTAIDQAFAEAVDENVSEGCSINTDPMSPDTDCFKSPITAVQQPGGSTIDLVVVRSLTVQAGAVITASGGVPVVIVSLSDIVWYGTLDANSQGLTFGPGGGIQAGSNVAGVPSPGGGVAGSASALVGGGGGSYCGLGGMGGGQTTDSMSYGGLDIRPLVAGASGGGGTIGSGAGGGGIQLVAAGLLWLRSGSVITVGGQAGPEGGLAADQNAGGAGSGGLILLEGQSVVVDGILAANGGGGGGDYSSTATDATPNATPAPGGAAGASDAAGGAGGAGATVNGSPGLPGLLALNAGGGGGGVGRIRINSNSGAAGGKGTYSPAASTTCTSFGTVRTLGSGQ